MKKKVVIIGGGNGSAIITQALMQNLDLFEIATVVSMSDSGGSSGRLRAEFNTLPPGDILRAVLAMSTICEYKKLKRIFNQIRFKEVGQLTDHNLGNLFLVLSAKCTGDYLQAVRALEQAVEAVGHVYPVTLARTDLVVALQNGAIIKTEGLIDRPNYDRNLKISRAWLEPAGRIYQGAKEVIEQADYIFLGLGSLYCSVVAALLPAGVKESVARSSAKLIYVAGNGYELAGETGPTKLSDFIRQLEQYLPRKLDYIVYDNVVLNQAQREKYKRKKWGLIEFDRANLVDDNIVAGDYEKEDGGLSKEKLGEILKKIVNQ